MLRALATLLLALSLPAAAQAQGGCLTADPPPITTPAHALRFGITPGTAGSAGAGQGAAAPFDRDRAIAALGELRTPGRDLVLRLNRLFWSDGAAGIERFAQDVDAYAAAGLRSEVQVRYHPPESAEGDIDAWAQFVRAAVRELGPRPWVVGFSITNEANLPISPNTSDGAYEGVVDALIRGVEVARAELRELGRGRMPVGFNVMWRWSPDSDAAFWEEIGAKATPAFRAGLTYVGLQVYPGLVWPPAPLPGRTAGAEVVEALTLVRGCYMPMAALGSETALWVTENGYATNLGRDEAGQTTALESTLRDVAAYSGELGVTDYRYFNLRDNDSDGADLFSAVGVLRDDHARKPSFQTLRDAIARDGRAEPPRLRMRKRRLRGYVDPPCSTRARLRASRRDGTVVRRRLRLRGFCRVRARLPRGTRSAVVRHRGSAWTAAR